MTGWVVLMQCGFSPPDTNNFAFGMRAAEGSAGLGKKKNKTPREKDVLWSMHGQRPASTPLGQGSAGISSAAPNCASALQGALPAKILGF